MTRTEQTIRLIFDREGTATKAEVLRHVPKGLRTWERMRAEGKIVPTGGCVMTLGQTNWEQLFRLS